MRISRRLGAGLLMAAAGIASPVLVAGDAPPPGSNPDAAITGSYPQRLDLVTAPVQLVEDDASVTSVGKLDYLYGWSLKSEHWQFGGFSTLLVDPSPRGGYRLRSLSDKGLWLDVFFDPENREAPFSNQGLRWQQPRRSLAGLDKPGDSESLVRAPLGYLVGYEGLHRIDYVTEPGGTSWTPDRMKALDFSGVSENGGIEAMAWTAGGKLLAFLERGRDTHGRLRAFLISETAQETVYFRAPDNFAPTDAATLPNGDILVLLRRFSQLEGIGAMLLRIRAETIAPGATLEGEEVATLAPPYIIDNMEGLDVGLDAEGRTLVYLMSDDNLNFLQRTLFLVFRLRED